MQVHRLQSPFKHWLSGLLAELAAFGVYILVVAIAVVILIRVF